MSTFSLSLKACFNKFFTQANISYNKCQLILSKTELLNLPGDIQLQSAYEYLILFCIIDKSCQETIVFVAIKLRSAGMSVTQKTVDTLIDRLL